MVDRGFRGWEVEYKNGLILNESNHSWHSISKNNIVRLTLYYDGRQWDIDGKKDYYQKKLGSAIPGRSGSFRIESRSIGYYEGNDIILFTVNEFTGRMKVEVKNLSNGNRR